MEGECTDMVHGEAEGKAENVNGLLRQYFQGGNRSLALLSGVPGRDRSIRPADDIGLVLQ